MHDPEQQQGLNIAKLLRNLPQETRQPYDWAEFRRRSHERRSLDARRSASVKKYAALAAVLVLAIVGIAFWVRIVQSHVAMPVASAGMLEEDPPILVDYANARADAAEHWLASLPDEPVVVHVGTRAAVAGLEDRIAQVDDLLSAARVEGAQPGRLSALELQRARLVNSLVQVRYAETLVAESR
jgi:hypothetical protein